MKHCVIPTVWLPLLLFVSCSFRMSREEAIEYFGPGVEPRFEHYAVDGLEMHYVETGLREEGAPLIVFVHGSPGSWSAFRDYLKDSELRSAARLVAVDRPGFGQSNPGQPEPSLKRQAELLSPVLRIPNARCILVGHSLGGPVIVRIAMDYPEQVQGLVIVAGSVDPDQERLEWYHKVADYRVVRWILPRDWDVSNQEILPLAGELQEMLPLWTQVRAPTLLVHGDEDGLVPYANVAFAVAQLTNASARVVRVEQGDHFILWSREELVRDAALALLRGESPDGRLSAR